MVHRFSKRPLLDAFYHWNYTVHARFFNQKATKTEVEYLPTSSFSTNLRSIIPLYISQVRLCGCPSQDNAGSSACLDEHLYPMSQEGQDRRWPYGACTGCSQAISFSSWGWSFVPIQNQLAISSQAELQTPPPPCVLSLPLQNEEKSQSNKTNAELT